jgi:hypothetical protein
MTDLLNLFLISCVVWVWVQSKAYVVFKIVYWTLTEKDPTKINSSRFKPFDCEMCLGFWCGLLYGISQAHSLLDVPEVLGWGALCSVFSCLITKFTRYV